MFLVSQNLFKIERLYLASLGELRGASCVGLAHLVKVGVDVVHVNNVLCRVKDQPQSAKDILRLFCYLKLQQLTIPNL